eukprot:TRINITY_DN781_c0_g1_i4.p2 TRINITY_DN781_c0_g1~~TRINITY_DN781_c0_g1_i4.p2  ORF type:complete len:163 (+),score=20.09 TRINITY_DN781_c0_g1_i4:222-710(+)
MWSRGVVRGGCPVECLGMVILVEGIPRGVPFGPLSVNCTTMDIKEGNFPESELPIQEMQPKQLNDFEFNPLDSTRHWPEDQFPYRPVGKMTLDELPPNFIEHTEQVAFSPVNMLVGSIKASEDRPLQSRLVSYFSAHEYRVGTNRHLIPVNKPRQRDAPPPL